MFAKFTGKHLWQRLEAVKKRLWHKCFPVNLAKFLRTPFLHNTSGRLLLLLAFQKQLPEVFYEKRCFWKFCKIYRKTPVICEVFRNTFLTEHPCNCNFTKMGHCQECLENLRWILYLKTLTLEVPFRSIISFSAA